MHGLAHPVTNHRIEILIILVGTSMPMRHNFATVDYLSGIMKSRSDVIV